MRTLTPEQRRPFGTCVAAGPAQFLDHQTCEPVNPRPQLETPHAAKRRVDANKETRS
jgi:hypothetical protein